MTQIENLYPNEAPGPIHMPSRKWKDPHTGRQMSSFEMGLKHFSAFYEPCAEMGGPEAYLEQGFYTGKWDTVSDDNKWLKGVAKVRNAHDARRVVANYTIPNDLKNEAKRLSREFSQTLMLAEGMPRTVRHLQEGRLDSQKYGRIVRDLRTGKYDRLERRDYKQRWRTAPKRPHIAVVCDGSWPKVWGDSQFIARAAAVSFGVAWAAQTVGCEVTAAMCRGTDGRSSWAYSAHPFTATIVHAQGAYAHPNSLVTLFHRDLYRHAVMSSASAHVETIRAKTGQSDQWIADKRNRVGISNEQAGTGGLAVSWARHAVKADLIIAVGTFKQDKEVPDVQIDSNTQLDKAIQAAARGLATFLRGY